MPIQLRRRLIRSLVVQVVWAWTVCLSLLPLLARAELPPIPLPRIGATPAPDTALPIYPRVYLNGSLHEAPAVFYLVQQTLYAERSTLERLGIQLQEADCPAPTNSAPIAQLPAQAFPLAQCTFLQSHYTLGSQRLDLQAPLNRLNLPISRLGFGSNSAMPELTRPDFSAVLNYDANIHGGAGGSSGRGLFTQWRWGTPWGYLETNHVQTHAQGNTTHQRLDTYWRSTWPDKRLRLTVGDTITSQIANSTGSRMTGIQLSSDYGVMPWYQTLPQNILRGSVEIPSTVDLYLNGVQQYSQSVNAGPYEIAVPPSISQAGQAQIVTRDVLGRQTVLELPLYDNTGLLAPGLQEWSIEAGYLRIDTGTASSAYDRNLLLSGTWRKGINNRLTVQLHGEGKSQYQQLGLALLTTAQLPQQVGLYLSSSRYRDKTGQQWGLFAQQGGKNWSVAAGLNQSSAYFTGLSGTLASGSSVSSPSASSQRKQAYVQMGWSLRDWGNFSLGRVLSQQTTQRQDVWTLNWSKNLAHASSLSIGVTYDRKDPQQRSAMISLSTQLGRNISASATAEYPNSHTILSTQLQKNTEGIGSWGWGLGWQKESATKQQNLRANVQYLSAYGDGAAQIYRPTQGAASWQSNWRGGLVLLGGKLAATRTVSDSFALVSTNGVADVPIRVQNNYVGSTDAQGLLFVPNLLAYQNNRVSIDSARLPADRRVTNSSKNLAPYEKAGSRLSFEVQKVRAWTATVLDIDGQFIPVGSRILGSNGASLGVVGFDGKAYVEGDNADLTTLRIFNETSSKKRQSCILQLKRPNAPVSFVYDYGELICQPD